MSQPDRAIDEAVWDRLVDGQLNPAEYRHLLGLLDERPTLWRRCALAFLEAQAWQRDLAEFAVPTEPLAAHSAERPKPVAGEHIESAPSAGLRLLFALAAAVVAAFALGHWSASLWPTAQGEPPVAHSVPPRLELPGAGDASPPITRAANLRENLTLTVPGENGQQSRDVEVPLVAMEEATGPWLNEQGSAIPADVLQTFRRLGHQVKQEREFVAVSLPDGRQVVVPVDRLEIAPLSIDTFQ